ncbi:hypothetical protein CD351_03720 [Erythrobacter sp. KY5]|uniref:transglycosylase SLT domain-containing protein n=1 Tax=Erythrobacter sp. KY5 TaxID=2011159 RepID=UPI000DBF0A41|nr:transglycosylase SLT domain-containing protein [Erythrobacter sp. KY5]AWW73534.1 hypothetical protein CD351_03720 [Erythrobacter sp. KY5]
MNPQSIPSSAIRSSFEQAARVHHAAQPRQGATRQIAAQVTFDASVPVRPSVEEAIANAAQATSVDFDFLVAQAQVESAMNPTARARTSSATGLYQFIESTWLGTMQRHGARFGLGNIAAQIDTAPGGTAYVADPQAREAILDMRNDPQVASLMAAGLAEDNRAHLAPILGRQPDHGELYLAHFLGAGGAGRFLSAMAQDPGQSAAALFRRPAAANQPVFYERNGAPRSLAGVMDYLSAKLERARADVPPGMPPSYTPASLAAADAVRPPYMIADEAVFEPRTPPVLTGRNRPTISASATLSLAAPSSRAPISDMLSSLDSAPNLGSEAHAKQVRRAYDQLKALGL